LLHVLAHGDIQHAENGIQLQKYTNWSVHRLRISITRAAHKDITTLA
jgi:hypothetical protein